jgi:hypothetical protein
MFLILSPLFTGV